MIWGMFESEEHKIVERKLKKFMNGSNSKAGTYNGDITYCPANAYGDCPYCDQCNVCHIKDPFEDCDDWCAVFDHEEGWDGWVRLD